MANSMATLSRRVFRSLLSNPKTQQLSMPFCTNTTTTLSSSAEGSESDMDSISDSPPSQSSTPSESAEESNSERRLYDRPLENGLDTGIYKAILVGLVGQTPVQKKLKSGMTVTMFSVGTGGIRNNRRPHENEEPAEYANRCAVQWHRVCVYQQWLGALVLKHAVPGSTVYLEGNLETKIFTDPITGLVRRVREISIRRNSRIVFLGNANNAGQPTFGEVKGAGQCTDEEVLWHCTNGEDLKLKLHVMFKVASEEVDYPCFDDNNYDSSRWGTLNISLMGVQMPFMYVRYGLPVGLKGTTIPAQLVKQCASFLFFHFPNTICLKRERKMVTTESQSQPQSADSYIGSFISLISKSEIRYEGVLFHINPQQSSIALKNVRTFGTEGRKKDGPQVAPSDKVFDYIYFRGSDIEDLQVLSSLSIQSTSAIPDDPAIIQSHYQHPAVSSSISHSSTSSTTSFSSNSHLGLPSSTFQGSVPQYQYVGHVIPLGTSTPTTINSNENIMPMNWQGLNGSSGDYSFLHQQSLLRPPPGLLASPGLLQMQHSNIDVSMPNAVPNFPEIPHPLFPPSSAGSLNSTLLPSSSAGSLNSTLYPSSSVSSLNSTLLPSSGGSSLKSSLLSSSVISLNSTKLPPSSSSSQNCMMLPPSNASSMNSTLISISSSSLHSNLPISNAASSVSNEASSYTAYYEPSAPDLALISSLPLASASISAVDTNNIALQFGEKSKSTPFSTSPYPNMSLPTPPIVGTSGSNHSEVPTPSLVTPSQLLQSAPTSPTTVLSSSLPIQTAQKDIEVVQTSTLELLSADANKAQAPSGEMNEASLDSLHHDKGLERGIRFRPYAAALHAPRSIRGYVEERENKSHHTNKVHVRGRRNGLHGTASHSSPSEKTHTRGIKKEMNGTARFPYCGRWDRAQDHAQGSTNRISHSVTKFTEDFDFEAMNEKFNKDEVWGQLGKGIKGISEGNGDADDSQEVEDGTQHEDGDGLLKVDIKPVYVKDEFFDSLSCNTFDREPKKRRPKFSEQKKLDAETFGKFQINHGGRGGRGVGHGGWSRGSRYGRGFGHGGRGQGRAMWSRVT
ncbi:hypothetical protein DITRI_Ditri04bG0002700 [Diplodiscus trichospermus]